MAEKLSEDAIETRLEEIPEWDYEDNTIERHFEFDDFLSAIAFINRVAPLAESADHHPEIFNVYNEVEISLTTHDVGGLTDKDFDLATRIDEVLST